MHNKTVVMSIQPEWVQHIFIDKDKIYEVRKKAPHRAPPYKVYVYCTKKEPKIHIKNNEWEGDINGFICGEFTCVESTEHCSPWKGKAYGTCLTERQLAEYSFMESLTFLKIENPILYNAPIKLEDVESYYVPQSWRYCKEITEWKKKD